MNFADIGPLDAAIYATVNVTLLVSAFLVFLAQPGFMMLEVGSVSRKNALNDIYKNFLDICLGAILFWLYGWDIIRGASPLIPFLEEIGLASSSAPREPLIRPHETVACFFHLTLAMTAATICGGAVSGRIRPCVYIAFAGIFAGLVYPLFAFTIWHPQGLLYHVLFDYAGSLVVSGAGAAAGLAGTLLLRPRIGFNGYDPVGLGREQIIRIAQRHAPHNMPVAAIGVFLIWVGWLGLSFGAYVAGGVPSVEAAGDGALASVVFRIGYIAGVAILAPAAAALTVAMLHMLLKEDRDLLDTMNGLIAGAVAVLAGVHVFAPWHAVVVGIVAAIIYRFSRAACERLSIDDPVQALASHGLPGLFGVGAASFVAVRFDMVVGFTQLGLALLTFAAIMGVSAALFIAICAVRKAWLVATRGALTRERLGGSMMRIDYRTEIGGIDLEMHGQDAYSFGAKD